MKQCVNTRAKAKFWSCWGSLRSHRWTWLSAFVHLRGTLFFLLVLGAVFSAMKRDGLLRVWAQVCRAAFKCIHTRMHVHTSIKKIYRGCLECMLSLKKKKTTTKPTLRNKGWQKSLYKSFSFLALASLWSIGDMTWVQRESRKWCRWAQSRNCLWNCWGFGILALSDRGVAKRAEHQGVETRSSPLSVFLVKRRTLNINPHLKPKL